MFYVKMDDLTLWSPIDNKLKIVSPTLKLEVNKIGSFSFKIYPDHKYYGRLEKMKSIISVHQGERILFKGRVYSDNFDFHKVRKVEVEGLLGYFNDSVVRPYEFSGSVEGYFTALVNQHNEQVTDAQKFKVGRVTVTDPNDLITRSSANAVKTWDEINNKLIKLLGGYISIRYEEDGNYVDYLADYSDTSTQAIAFAVNLLDLELENKADSLSTCIIPYGAKGEDGKKIDITSVNDGVDYIYDADAVARYGRIFEVVTWEDVTVPANLLRKARLYLADKIKLLSKLTVKAIDLHLADETIEAFKLGDYVRIFSEPHEIDERVLLTAYSMDLTNPSGCTITLGVEKSSFLGEQMEANKDSGNRVDIVRKEVGELTTVIKNNVKSVTVLYYLSTSATELVGGEWTTDLPEWVEGCYYWQKTVTVHVDGTTVESAPICITGVKGADGKTQYLHIKYSNDGKTFTGNMVSTSIEDWKSGYYTTGKISQAYTITSPLIPVTSGTRYYFRRFTGYMLGITQYTGENGETFKTAATSGNGTDTTDFTLTARDITYIRVYYRSTDTTATFATFEEAFASGEMVPFVWADGITLGEDLGAYIGTLVDFNETASNNFDDYTWKKLEGKDGLGVENIASQFYLSSSKTELIGGSWVDVMPEWSVGDFLWIRNVITYSDGSVSYTEPVCDSSWTAIENLEVGGRNYLRKTDVTKYSADWLHWGSTLELAENGFLKVTPTDDATGVGAYPPKLATIKAGETYTVSFEAYAENDVTMSYFYIMDDDGNKKLDNSVDIKTTPIRYSFTFTAAEDYEYCSILFGYATAVSDPCIFYLREPKLEKGNKATDWTPAPEDNTTELTQYVQETYTYINESIENSEETTRTMLAEYAKVSDVETVREEVSTKFTQTAEDFNFQFDTVNERITEENGEIARILEENSKYIRLVDGNIILGEEGAPLTTKIANGRISFLYNDTVEVAYISEQKLYITKAEILESIVIGNFAYIPRPNGNLSFKKI